MNRKIDKWMESQINRKTKQIKKNILNKNNIDIQIKKIINRKIKIWRNQQINNKERIYQKRYLKVTFVQN